MEMSSFTNRKRDRFKRLAASRTNEVMKRLRVLGNCANQNAYDYTPADVKKIFDAIEDEVRVTKAKFAGTKHREFTLDEPDNVPF
jgi:hypothetical protein